MKSIEQVMVGSALGLSVASAYFLTSAKFTTAIYLMLISIFLILASGMSYISRSLEEILRIMHSSVR